MIQLEIKPPVPRRVACPTCGSKTAWDAKNKFRPFCSERCKLVDLGQWADEGYRVAGQPLQDETTSLLSHSDNPTGRDS